MRDGGKKTLAVEGRLRSAGVSKLQDKGVLRSVRAVQLLSLRTFCSAADGAFLVPGCLLSNSKGRPRTRLSTPDGRNSVRFLHPHPPDATQELSGGRAHSCFLRRVKEGTGESSPAGIHETLA